MTERCFCFLFRMLSRFFLLDSAAISLPPSNSLSGPSSLNTSLDQHNDRFQNLLSQLPSPDPPAEACREKKEYCENKVNFFSPSEFFRGDALGGVLQNVHFSEVCVCVCY